MILRICELTSILFSALVLGAIWGPWLALGRSVATFNEEVFLAVSHRMIRNLEPVMMVLIPAALLSIVPVVYISFYERPKTAYLAMAAFGFFVVSVVVAALQVSIVDQIKTWTVETLPDDWQRHRDRWKVFQVTRIIISITGLAFLVTGAII